MANYRRNGPRGRARWQAEQRRLRLIIFGGTAAVVLIALLVVALLPRGGAPDRAVSQPVEGVLQAEGEPLTAQALAGGATGYLLKDSGKDAILNAIDRAVNGQSVLDGKVMEKLTRMMAGAASEGEKKTSSGDIFEGKDLTDREKEICRLIAEGCTNSQIASILFISEGTVKNYMSSIYDKFDIHDRAKLALMLRG